MSRNLLVSLINVSTHWHYIDWAQISENEDIMHILIKIP
jgi:hypothetical protein